MKLSRRQFLFAGSAAVISAACTPTPAVPSSGPAAPGATAAGTPASSPAAVLEVSPPLKIGILAPYTEQAVDADIGSSQKRAADLYVKQHGGALGGRRVDLAYSDESVDPNVDKVKVQQVLLGQEHAAILLGGAATTTAYVMRDAAEAAKIVYIDTSAPGNALTRAASDCKPSCKSRYVFRTSASSWQINEPFGEWASSRGGPKDFFLCYADDPFGTESADACVAGLGKNGGRVAGRTSVPRGSDWVKLIGRVGAQPTKSIFAAFVTDDAEGFLTSWAAAHLSAAGYTLYGPGFLTDTEVLRGTKNAAIGAVTSLFWSTELDNADNKALVTAFRQAYKDDETGEPLSPDAYAVAMWDAMAALDQALSKTKGDASADALIPALEGVSLRSPRGAVAFDKATHGLVQDIYIREVRASAAGPVNAVIDRIPKVADPGA